MFVGEGPGFHEDQQARPFVGPAGKLLDDLMALGGLKRSDVYITNVVKCRPPNNRDPLPAEVEACKKHLDQQLELIKPKLLVTLGRYSLSWFFPRDSISKVHGHLRRQNGSYFLHMYHPAAALHAGNLRKTIEDDFRKIPQALAKISQAEQPVAVGQAATEQGRLF
jgi:DNA polymerase